MKKTQIEHAIEQLEGERAVLDAAIAKLKQQQVKTTKKPRVVERLPARTPDTVTRG